jgi:hypothetical protein
MERRRILLPIRSIATERLECEIQRGVIPFYGLSRKIYPEPQTAKDNCQPVSSHRPKDHCTVTVTVAVVRPN